MSAISLTQQITTSLSTVEHPVFKKEGLNQLIADFALDYFDWRKRPPELESMIDRAFDYISRQSLEMWGVMGMRNYDLCEIDAHKLISQMILEAPLDQKDFYVLDIGCGNGAWLKELKKHLDNALGSKRQDMRIHLIGVGGENLSGVDPIPSTRCTIHIFGQFKIENLQQELEKRGLKLAKQIDAAVSHFCLFHLCDPLGTFMQAYELLRPQRGYILFDGFSMQSPNRRLSGHPLIADTLVAVINQLNAPFLIARRNEYRYSMVLRKADGESQLTVHYDGIFPKKAKYYMPKRVAIDWQEDPEATTIHGTNALFQLVQERDLFRPSSQPYKHFPFQMQPHEKACEMLGDLVATEAVIAAQNELADEANKQQKAAAPNS